MDSPQLTRLGDLLRNTRLSRNLTIEELCALAGVGVRTLSDLERHRIERPQRRTIEALVDALGLTGTDRDAIRAAARPPLVVPHGDDPAGSGPPTRAAVLQLPTDLNAFAGRCVHLDAAIDLVAEHHDRLAPVVAVVVGMAGVGKTTFAVHWAHRVAARFPDGQIYLNLRGFDPSGTPTPPEEAIRAVLESLGVDTRRLPAHPAAQHALYRSMLAERRMILLLDNARDAEQARRLIAGGPGSLVIVTSRAQLGGIVATEAAHPIHLDVLSDQDARELLAKRLGPQAVTAEPEAIQEIIDRCGRLPLALAVVAARSAARPRFRFADIAAELRDSGTSLDALEAPDPLIDARSVFSWSHAALTPPAARLFRHLALHPGPEVSVSAAAALIGATPRDARRQLDELADAVLIEEVRPGRYAWHDLLQSYAHELGTQLDPVGQRRLARRQLFDHLVRVVAGAAEVLNPHRPRYTPLPVTGGTTITAPGDYAEALAWTVAEYPVLLAAIASAAEDLPEHAWHLARELETFQGRSGRWADMITVQRYALTCARTVDDPIMTAQAYHSLGKAYVLLDEYSAGYRHASSAASCYRAAGYREGESNALVTLADAASSLDRPEEATRHYEAAIDLFRTLNSNVGMASALNNFAGDLIARGELDRAVALCAEALAGWAAAGDRHGRAHSQVTLGTAYQRQGRHDQAIAALRPAAVTLEELGTPFHAAEAHAHLGDSCDAMGDRAAAREAWGSAVTLLAGFSTPVATRLRDRLVAGLGRRDTAVGDALT